MPSPRWSRSEPAYFAFTAAAAFRVSYKTTAERIAETGWRATVARKIAVLGIEVTLCILAALRAGFAIFWASWAALLLVLSLIGVVAYHHRGEGDRIGQAVREDPSLVSAASARHRQTRKRIARTMMRVGILIAWLATWRFLLPD